LKADKQPFQLLQPGESTRFGFRIADCRLAGNAFPVTARVSSRPASATEAETLVTEMTEVLSVATIVNASIKVDGFLDEWPKAGAVPVLATRSEDAALRTKPLWCPWSELRQAALGTFARVAFAWDNTNLYVMAQVYDPEATRVPSLLSGVDRHQWQNAPADYIYYLPGPWPGSTGDGVLLSMDSANRSEWVRRYEEFPPDSNSYHLGSVLAGRYQYQVYPTREGGTEVFRFRTPDFYYRHQLPLNYARLAVSCAVPQAAAVCKRRTDTWYYEAAIPWSELGRLPHGKGQRLRINFRINDDTAAQGLVWSKNRSVAVPTYLDFEPTWVLDWSSETEWGFDAADRPPGASDARR